MRVQGGSPINLSAFQFFLSDQHSHQGCEGGEGAGSFLKMDVDEAALLGFVCWRKRRRKYGNRFFLKFEYWEEGPNAKNETKKGPIFRKSPF